MKNYFFILSFLSFTVATFAQPPQGVSFEPAVSGGPGCPAGQILLKWQGSKLTAQDLKAYDLRVGANESLARATCDISSPFKLDSGKALRVHDFKLSGKRHLSAGSSLDLEQELFTSGSQSPQLEQSYNGSGSFRWSAQPTGEQGRTACGAGGIYRIHTSAVLKGGSGDEAQIDSGEWKFEVVDCSS